VARDRHRIARPNALPAPAPDFKPKESVIGKNS
jgi:hypothetical protein